MKKYLLFSFNFVLILTLLVTLPASAQGTPPPIMPPASTPSHPPQSQPVPEGWQKPWLPETLPVPTGDLSAQSIQMGASGTSYRLLGQFGITGQPYPIDLSHLNNPNGLFISGTDLYVVEEAGARMLKFDLTSIVEPRTATLAIGHAGVPFSHDDYLSNARDVTVDAGGNIWVAMNNAVKEFDPSGTLLRMIPAQNPWETGIDNYHFNDPNGLAFGPGGFLYVVDRNNQRVQVYDVSGADPVYVTTVGETGVPHSDNLGFNRPNQVVFDSANRMYVLENNNFRVQRCESPDNVNWSCTTAFGETGVPGNDLTHLAANNGLAMFNDQLYIMDSWNRRVLKCPITTSLPIVCQSYIDSSITGGDFSIWPADVALDASGKIYVSDLFNDRIQVFEDTGSGPVYQDTIGITRVPYVVNPSYMNAPWGIAVASDGSMYVTENAGSRLRKFNAVGAELWKIGEAGVWGNDNGHLNWPEGNPAIDASGRVYVTDTGNNRVQIFTPAGVFVATIGNNGTGTDFSCPSGVAIHPVSGDIYIVDRCNQRIQIFTAARAYKGTIGMTGSSGQDNWRFNYPHGLAVDKNGNVFVADTENHRVQKCALSADGYNCATFVGNENYVSNGFGYLHPLSVALDSAGRVFVADDWNGRVQVFDASGAYLTTMGGNWGQMNGDMSNAYGVALDAAGNVYATDSWNHRIQKYAPGYPSWKQVNVNGFGMPDNSAVMTLTPFGSYLYAGTGSGQLWRSSNGTTWLPVLANGFDSSGNAFDHLFVFGNKLYAGMFKDSGAGGSLWRSSNGLNWEQVTPSIFNSPANAEVLRLASYGNQLYFSTWVWDSSHGAELWRSPSGNSTDWTQIEADGFGDLNNSTILDFRAFGTNFYASTVNSVSGTEIWRSPSGNAGTWVQVNTDGFGDTGNNSANLAVFGGKLYAVTGHKYDNISGAQIWTCTVCGGSDWSRVLDPFANPKLRQMPSLTVVNGALYLTAGVRDLNNFYGLNVYRSTNGTTWSPVATAGFGNKNNMWSYWGNAQAVFNEQLFIGTGNYANGGQIWRAAAPNLTRTFYSAAAQDGFILESGENTNLGGGIPNSTDVSLILGDDALKRQYRSILSFNTAPIPDGAVINSATLKLKQNGALIGNPLGTLGNMQVDLRKPNFGLSPNLELADFNFAATSANVCTIGKVPSLGWYSGVLNAAGKSNLNKAGLTQFRVFFTLDDNNNLIADTIKFFSGNSIATNWPQLIVNYSLP